MKGNQVVRVNGIEYFYIDEGVGQPIIFIHGSLATHTVWQPYYERLQSQCRVIAPDLRGHGQTTSVTGAQITFDMLTQDIVGFIEALNLNDVWLCGWSAGGDLALQAALALPNRVSKLVIGGVTLRASETSKQTLMAMGLNADGSLNLEQAQKAIPHLIENWKAIHTQSDDHWQRLINQIGTEMMNPHVVDLDDLANITTETLILWGDRDQFLPIEEAIKLYKALPNTQLAVIPNADHFVTRTHIDFVYPLIESFLS